MRRQRVSGDPSIWLVTIALLVMEAGTAAQLLAQELPHPREMGFTEVQIQIPDTARFEFRLENGLTGFAVQDGRMPLVQISAFIRVGTGDANKRGVAEVLAMLLRRGPCWMGPNRFREAMDRMAGKLTIVMTRNMTEITLNVPTEDAAQGIRIFSGIIRAPCIEQDGLEEFRRRGVSAPTPPVDAVVENGSLELAVDLFNRRLFEGHRYSEVITSEDAAAITIEDVEDFHRDFFSPGNMVLAVSGALDAGALLSEVDQRFADWEARRLPRLQTESDVRTPVRATYRYRSDKLQTWIVIGHELPRVSPDDLPALQVMNYILGGGHFDTRLFREARDKRGLTNDASGFLEFNLRGPGTYTFRTYGRHEVAQQLIDLTFAEIERIRSELVSEEELLVAKGALTDGEFAMKFANGHAVARTFAQELARYGTFRHLFGYVRRVRSVSREDVRRAARRYLHPERMAVVIVGR
ncbi:MAG: insulinase family protein [Gemmatimonadetes bacterium]|nr:insulinase family protein [Gemmatimonadota bacterium]